MRLVARLRKSIKGQGLVEYGLILALVSVVAVGSLGSVGDKVADTFDNSYPKTQPIEFGGVQYDDISQVPDDPVTLFDYEVIGEEITITGLNKEYIDQHLAGIYPSRISIPSQIEGLDVVSLKGSTREKVDFKNVQELALPNTLKTIGNNVFFESDIKHLVVPNSVEVIGNYAFTYNNMEKVDLGDSLRFIRTGAFERNRLTEIVIPDSIESIYRVAFYNNRIEKMTFPNKHFQFDGNSFSKNSMKGENAFIYGMNKDGSVDKSLLMAYAGRGKREITIPEGVKEIGSSAFYYESFFDVVFPDSLQLIGTSAFRGSRSMNPVYLPKGTKFHPTSFANGVVIKEKIMEGSK